MINISCVSYLNSAPFIYGIRKASFSEEISLSLDTPSECAQKLIAGSAHIGLVPVASIPGIGNAEIISDFCIGANGPVQSVTLLGEVPVWEMKEILLDYQSMTSVALVRVLAREHWKVQPQFRNTGSGYESEIKGTTGGVVIGDRSLFMRNTFPVVYDLAEEWKDMTGLPFVFACWVSNMKLPQKFHNEFNAALATGVSNLDAVIAQLPEMPVPAASIKNYLEHSISYNLDEAKRRGLELFQSHLEALEPLGA